MTRSLSNQVLGLLAWLLAVFAVAATGGFASANAGGFYRDLLLPAWAPPGWVFGPVWTILYTFMAMAAWLVWRQGGFNQARSALLVFILQLAANGLWTWLFFAWHLGAVSFAEIVLLWVLIVATIGLFWRVSRLAAALLIPYLLWVSFAAALNFAIWQLNPAILR